MLCGSFRSSKARWQGFLRVSQGATSLCHWLRFWNQVRFRRHYGLGIWLGYKRPVAIDPNRSSAPEPSLSSRVTQNAGMTGGRR